MTIIPRARMGSESVAHEADGRIAIDTEAMKARGIIVLIGTIQLVDQKYRYKTTLAYLAKRDSAAIVLVFKAGAFRY